MKFFLIEKYKFNDLKLNKKYKMSNNTPTLFNPTDSANWKKFLNDEGYVVLNGILPKEEKDKSMEIFKHEWCEVSPNFSWEDSSSWTIQNCPMMFGKGMAVFNGFGQSNFMWSLRTNPHIYKIFQEVHQTEDLVVSLDGFSVYLSDKQKSKSWLHIDQNPTNELFSIQGAYNFMPVGEKDAGFVLVPKSHKIFKPKVNHKKDWIQVDQYEFSSQAIKLIIPENCFVLWNSKTIHANKGMSKGTNGFNRLTTYITYLPKSLRSDNILIKRQQAYLDTKTTSHWANKCEVKKYPWGFKPNYEKKGFGDISCKLDENGFIPDDRLKFL